MRVVINRQKLGLEDLALGEGTEVQTRGGVDVEVTRINIANLFHLLEGNDVSGFGDMLKSVYDTSGNGVVDEAESVPWEGVYGAPTVGDGGLTEKNFTSTLKTKVETDVAQDIINESTAVKLYSGTRRNSWTKGLSGFTGAICVELVNLFGYSMDGMMSIRIKESSLSSIRLSVSGRWNASTSWGAYDAISDSAINVRFARDASKVYLIIGDVSTVWGNTRLEIDDVLTNYNAGQSLSFSVTTLSSLTGYTVDATLSTRRLLSSDIGSNVQGYDATLSALAGVTTSADKYFYATASDTFTTGTITSFGRSLVDDADAATARTTLGISATNTPSTAVGGISATNVQSALQELDREKINTADLLMAIGNINSPLLDMPLKNSLVMKAGVGSATFTRASTATYIDRYGVLKTATVDEPRFEKEGYLNEGTSTNLLTYSEQFDNAVWDKTRVTISANTTYTLDPYGTNLADKLIEDTTATSTHTLGEPYSFTSGNTYTLSVFVKAAERSVIALAAGSTSTFAINCAYNLSSGTIISQTLGTASIEPYANGWYRCSVTGVAGATAATNCNVYLSNGATTSYTGDGTSGLYIFGAQLEALPFATSYIPTTSATVTRATDILNVTRAGNMPNLEADGEISIAMDIQPLGTMSSNQWIWGLYSASTNAIGAYVSSSLYYASMVASSTDINSVATTGGPISTISKTRMIQVVNNNGNTIYRNGVYAGFDPDGDNRITDTQNSAFSTVCIGCYNPTLVTQVGQFFGHISNFRVWGQSLTAQEVALA